MSTEDDVQNLDYNQRSEIWWNTLGVLLNLGVFKDDDPKSAGQILESLLGGTFYTEWMTVALKSDFPMTRRQIETCKALQGPHGYALFKALEARKNAPCT